MAEEITINASLAYADSEGSDVLAELSDLTADVATKRYVLIKQNVGTSEEALNLGDISAPGWVFVKNLSETNYVEIKTGTGGTIFAKLLPGEVALLRLGSGAQAPYVIANSTACQIESLIVST